MTEQNRQDALTWAEVQLDEHKNCGCVLCRQAHALLDLDRQCRERDERIASLTEQFEASEYVRELHSCGATTERLRAALEQIEQFLTDKPLTWSVPLKLVRDALSATPPTNPVPLPPRANPPVIAPHDTVPVRCVVDVDKAVAPLVEYLNTIPGVRTFASCEGGLCYGPQVMVSWMDRKAFDWLAANYPLINIETADPVEFGRESVAYIARREEWTLSAAPGESHPETKRLEGD